MNVMIGDGPLMLREFLMNEPHPLALVQRAVFEFLREQTDYAIFGAQAVNAYVNGDAFDRGRRCGLAARRGAGEQDR